VRRDGHAVRAALEGAVERRDVALVLALRVAADGGDELALGWVVEVGQAGVVELQVRAAELAEAADLLGVGRAEVVPERVEVGVDRGVDPCPPGPVVHHARRRDRELRRAVSADDALQRLEVLAEDRRRNADPPGDGGRDGLEGDRPARVVELDVVVLLRALDALQAVDEVHVPRRAAELAVGERTQPDVALQAHRV
jgi:hypothetical protein